MAPNSRKKQIKQRPIRALNPGERKPPNYLGVKLDSKGREREVNWQGYLLKGKDMKFRKEVGKPCCLPPAHRKKLGQQKTTSKHLSFFCSHCCLPGCMMNVCADEFERKCEERKQELMASPDFVSWSSIQWSSVQNQEYKKCLRDQVSEIFSKQCASHPSLSAPKCGVSMIDKCHKWHAPVECPKKEPPKKKPSSAKVRTEPKQLLPHTVP